VQVLYSTSSRRLRPHGEEARSKIMSVIQCYAGIRYSELARKTNLAHGTLSHHIKMLQRQRRIRVRKNGSSTRLFPESYDDGLCNAIASADHPTTIAIMALLLGHECSYEQIKNTVMKSGSTICEHLKRLHSAGLISRRRVDRVSVYGIRDADKAIMIVNRRYGNWQ
jgi:predicted transcriptional regulator